MKDLETEMILDHPRRGCPVSSQGGREHFDTDSRGEACV